MIQIINPFITTGYVSAEYFCDRESEREELINLVTNGNNLALISPRRMGKTGLIMHCFSDKKIEKNYYTFFIDIYATKSLQDFVLSLSKVILEQLKSFGKKAIEIFLSYARTLQPGVSFDLMGNPSFNMNVGDFRDSRNTLDEIFNYLNNADKPCIVAIDEFQQIASYPEENLEAVLRTYIQHCNNARFIFAGSQRHIMSNIFLSPSRPFYQSVSMLYLESIPVDKYIEFAKYHFSKGNKKITEAVVTEIYSRFEGITWYIQKMLNMLYMMTGENEECNLTMVDIAQESVVASFRYSYEETLFRLPEKQKNLLIAIAKEGKAQAVTGSLFVKKYHLPSASSVQSALKGLLDKDFVSTEQGTIYVYDRFFALWLIRNY
ncbi:MAG: AAA family ATPase [Bacteroidales bacterium]